MSNRLQPKQIEDYKLGRMGILGFSAVGISDVITTLSLSFDDDLFQKTEAELEENWFFRWDDSISLEENTYRFYDMLKLYGSFCRRWEERHNGSCCVVERIRDKYLMPKIKKFVEQITSANAQKESYEQKQSVS